MKSTRYHLAELSMVVLLVVILIFHFILYPDYFLPWYDEALFQDVSLSLLQNGNFDVTIHPLINGGRPFLMHGPIFYTFQAISFFIFGKTDAVFDFTGILFFLLILITWRLYYLGKGLLWTLFGMICLASDAILCTAAHSGRMDIMAVFFSLLAFLIAIIPNKKMLHYFILGFSASLAFLTTPRIAIAIGPIFFFLFFFAFFYRRDALEKIGTLSAFFIFLVLWIIWVFTGFGGFREYFDYFLVEKTQHLEQDGNLISKFIGGNFAIKKTQYVLLGSILILSLRFIFTRANKWYQKPMFLLPLSIIIIYQISVYDTGNYSALYICFAYFLLIYLLNNANITTGFKYTIIAMVLISNLGAFAVKTTYLMAADPYKAHDLIGNFIDKSIKKGTKVLGSSTFYPILRQKGYGFRLLSFQETDKEKNIQDILRNYNPEYILIHPREEDELKVLIESGLRVRKINEFHYANSMPTYERIASMIAEMGLQGSFMNDFVEDYEGTKVYRILTY